MLLSLCFAVFLRWSSLRLVFLCLALFPSFGMPLSSLAFGELVPRSLSGAVGVFILALLGWVLVSAVLLPRADLRFPSQRGVPLGRVMVCCFLSIARFSGCNPVLVSFLVVSPFRSPLTHSNLQFPW